MSPQVLVVGAGPTGLLLAAELERRGVRCLLIDAQAEPRHWDRASMLHPRSLEVFEALGIVGRLLETGVRQQVVRLFSDGRPLGEIDLAAAGSHYGFNVGVSEEVTESVLTDYLQGQGGSVTRSTRLVGFAASREEVTVKIELDGASTDVPVQWVVGCDGLHSAARDLSGIDFEGHDIAEPWAVFDAALEGWKGEFGTVVAYWDAPPVILTALPEQRWRIYLRPSSPEADLVDEAARVISRYQPRASLVDVRNPSVFHCHTRVASRYRSGRVLLAGDAAHVCTPAQGHGMNSGLQDAFNLAWKLALVCQGVANLGLLDSYEAERRPVAIRVAESGDMAEQLQTITDPTQRAARDDAVSATFADPRARHNEVVAEAELDISYADSPIVVGDQNERLGPGERLPDGMVHPFGFVPCRLHQLVNRTGHILLVLLRPGVRKRGSAELVDKLRESVARSSVFDAVIALSTDPDPAERLGRLEPSFADELGVDDATMLAVRPDGHVGLRHDAADSAALRRYLALIESGTA
jgi:2-polyprenyl-6-methoxyphenol hydroxylase-like FAD-dependent oxidoreductase